MCKPMTTKELKIMLKKRLSLCLKVSKTLWQASHKADFLDVKNSLADQAIGYCKDAEKIREALRFLSIYPNDQQYALEALK